MPGAAGTCRLRVPNFRQIRLNHKTCGIISGFFAFRTMPDREKGMLGRSLPWPASSTTPAALGIKLPGQEPPLANKPYRPCRFGE